MDHSSITIEGILISTNDNHDIFIENVSKLESILNGQKRPDLNIVFKWKSLCLSLLEKMRTLKDDTFSTNLMQQLSKCLDSCKSKLFACCSDKSIQVRLEALKSLIELLPFQAGIGAGERNRDMFPDNALGEIIKVIISSESNISIFLPVIEDLLTYEDISRNIWKALEISSCKLSGRLSPQEVSNMITIINCTEKPLSKNIEQFGPVPYFCRVSGGILSDKAIGNCIKRFWDKMISVDLPPKVMQNLLIVLYERLMPRMNKPVFLIDFLMNSLEKEGPVGLLALQGIFTLIQKYNMNYPDVYGKIYAMLNPRIFGTQYKARFYYLMDMFLSSSHLPEALVAGFIKKLARLSLQAPPHDIIIMLTFIVNLIIRHPGLKRLINNPSEIAYESDPYNIDELDPALSHAIVSSLWEVELLRHHVLPSVSSAANFINNPLPATEKDLSDILESTAQEIFLKEYKKKLKDPPVSFEKPSSLFVSNISSGFSLWRLT